MGNSGILLIGGGGHCRSVLDSLLNAGKYDRIGIVERELTQSVTLGIGIVGIDADLPRLREEGWTDAFVTLGSVGDPSKRRTLYALLCELGYRVPAIVDPTAIIARDVEIGDGVWIGKGAIVNTGSRIGTCAIINTGSIIEHDCRVGDFAHVSPGCTLCGETVVGENTHIGAGAVSRQQIHIGRNALIGAGSVIVSDLPDHVLAFGNPCRVVKENAD